MKLEASLFPCVYIQSAYLLETVDAVMLTGATSTEEKRTVNARLAAMASGAKGPEVKLCYVTVKYFACYTVPGSDSLLKTYLSLRKLPRINSSYPSCKVLPTPTS